MSELEPLPEMGEQKPDYSEYIACARELSERKEKFTFPGLNPEYYVQLKSSEVDFPGFTTPIDELIAQLQTSGMKVVSGPNPDSGNIYILPFDSTDISMDSLFPRHLDI